MPDGRGYTYSGTGTATSASISWSGTVSGTAGTCPNGCSGFVAGSFFGASADRIGTTYRVQDTGGPNVVGAAAFQKSGP
jgi:hypothetical protein